MRRRDLLATSAALAASPEDHHPDFKPHPRLEEIFRDLSAPLYTRPRAAY